MNTQKIKLSLCAAAILCLTSCSSMDGGLQSRALQEGLAALTVTNADIQEYVRESVKALDAQNKIAPASNPYAQRLAKITSGIKSVNGTPLNFKVYLTNDVNAFACPDGSVRVFSGLMDIMNDNEVLGVIGHEIGHVAHEDSKQQFQQALLHNAVLDLIGSTSSTAATLTQSQLGALAHSLLSAKYSRSQESKADDYGYDFLKSQRRNPYSMVTAFKKLQKLEGQSGNSSATQQYLSNMFSDHPETAERIKRMTDRARKDGYIK